MVENKNNSSVVAVMEGKKVIGYLSNRAIENGLDSFYDLQGYTIVAL